MIKNQKKEKMKSNNIKILVVCSLFFILNSCGIPKIITQENKVVLPTNYDYNLKTENSSGKVKWKDFFEDPYFSNKPQAEKSSADLRFSIKFLISIKRFGKT